MRSHVRFTAILLSLFVAVASVPDLAGAQVQVVRTSEENPVKEIFKGTIYGAGAGLVLGLAAMLVVDEDKGEVLKWCFVGGTFFGFGYGVYHVMNRPQPKAALGFDRDGLANVSMPTPTVRLAQGGDLGVQVRLVSFEF